jgi:hypothetical protein
MGYREIREGILNHAAASKATPVGADEVLISDSGDSWVGKRATLTGAVSAALGGSIIYAVNHGVGPGVTDNAPPINALIEQAANRVGGATIVLPPGVLNVRSSVGRVGFTALVGLTGSGYRGTTLKASGPNMFPVIFGGVYWYCSFTNLTINANNSTEGAIKVHIDRSMISDLMVGNWGGRGLSINDGTYTNNLGLMNQIKNCIIAQPHVGGGNMETDRSAPYNDGAEALFSTYRLCDTRITNNYFASKGTNISIEGVGLSIIGNHLNGEAVHHILCRTSDWMMIANNNFDRSKREAIVWRTEPWTSVTQNCNLQVVGNFFVNASLEQSGTYSVIRISGESNKRPQGALISNNIFVGLASGGGADYLYAVRAENVDGMVVNSNLWMKGRVGATGLSTLDCTGVVSTGNSST